MAMPLIAPGGLIEVRIRVHGGVDRRVKFQQKIEVESNTPAAITASIPPNANPHAGGPRTAEGAHSVS